MTETKLIKQHIEPSSKNGCEHQTKNQTKVFLLLMRFAWLISTQKTKIGAVQFRAVWTGWVID